MKALTRKALRDLSHLKGQVLTIAIVVGSGMAGYISMSSTYQSLLSSKESYETRSRFADGFARVQYAPLTLAPRLQSLPGLSQFDMRVVVDIRLEIPQFPELVRGHAVSLSQPQTLNVLTLLSGRLPTEPHEVILSEAFAKAHGLREGSRISAYLLGKKTALRIVGTATSPEYISVMADFTQMGDDRRYGVLWMPKTLLASAFHFENGMNDLTFALAPHASKEAVLSEVDRLLAPYGSLTVHGRDRQPSNQLIEQELQQLKTSATFAPLIFLGVSAFLLHVLLSRLVEAQREQLATLKALGYSAWPLAWHVISFALLITALGSLLGLLGGVWIGRYFIGLYAKYFHFPVLVFQLHGPSMVLASGLSILTGVAGAFSAMRRTLRLAPAEAMRPEAPTVFHKSLIERLGLLRFLPLLSRMGFREFDRHRLRTLFSIIGVALATSILVVGNMGLDAIEHSFAIQFDFAQREDLTVSFSEPLPKEAVHAIARLPGVLQFDTRHGVPIRLHSEGASRELVLWGMPEPQRVPLQQLIDVDEHIHSLPEEGLLLSKTLATLLTVKPGDGVTVDFLEGKRKTTLLPVTAVIEDALGLQAYAREDNVARWLNSSERVTHVFLKIDPAKLDELQKTLADFPKVLSVSRKQLARDKLQATIADSFSTMQTALIFIAVAIAVGVVYNNARIALALRSRDLATLRILGFQRTEVGALLLGEQLLQLALGIPLGLPLGRAMGTALFSLTEEELFRIPVVVSSRTWATAAWLVFLAGWLSGLWVSRKAQTLDLIGVLKARD